jgi:hypothetical protein
MSTWGWLGGKSDQIFQIIRPSRISHQIEMRRNVWRGFGFCCDDSMSLILVVF